MNGFSPVKCGFALLIILCVSATPLIAQSQELPLGSSMPTGPNLTAVDGQTATLANRAGSNGTVVVFWSNQCTWVDRYEDRLLQLHQNFSGQGINFVLVNSNDANAFPQESVGEMRNRANSRNYPMAYVRDDGGQLARTFGAARTPHVYVFDGANSLVYVGAIDDSPGDPGNVQNRYLRDALNAVVNGREVSVSQTKAFGCSIRTSN